MRLRPFMGESLERSGLMRSVEKPGLCCSTWPATAATIIRPTAGPATANRPQTARPKICAAPPESIAISSGRSRKTRKCERNTRAAPAPAARMASVPPESTMKVDSSVLLTTSPFLCASSSRLCVGSSVRCESSRSSAMASGEQRHLAREEIQEGAHHDADQQRQQHEADQDVDRHGQEEALQLRHQARDHAQRDIDQE